MKRKILIVGIVLLSISLVSCKGNDPSFHDAELINTIYRSLDCTSEQFTDSIVKYGLHVTSISSAGVAYQNSARNETDKVGVSTHVKNDTITRVVFERYLNGISAPADYYKLLSSAIFDHGYTDWHGYYSDPAERGTFVAVENGNYSSTEEASNRSDFYSHLDNEHLKAADDSEQCYAETFTYTHVDGSRWRGDLILHGETHFEHGLFDGEGNYVKHIYLRFMLRRIG